MQVEFRSREFGVRVALADTLIVLGCNDPMLVFALNCTLGDISGPRNIAPACPVNRFKLYDAESSNRPKWRSGERRGRVGVQGRCAGDAGQYQSRMA